jgi:Flp pilus assembly protein TadG
MLLPRWLKGRHGGLTRFLKDRRGGVAPMFALAVIPVVGLVGAAVDYSRANAAKAGMQAALDATALAMAKLAPTLTQSQLQTQTAAYFNAMFSYPEAKNLTITPTYSVSGGAQLTVTGSASIDTSFMSVMGHSSLNIGSSSTVRWGMNRLRVALALDNTGSMAGAGKIDALKTATRSLLDQLKAAAANNGDVYVSIIPFNKDVNVGTSGYTNASWVDWEDWDDDNGEDNSTTTCTTKKTGKSGKPKKKCTTTTSWIPDNHNTWNGCITDRDKDYDVNATVPTATTPATLFPAEQYSACPVPLTGLSYDWNKLNSLVNTMKAAGTTNQTIGLVWAWMSLTGGGPFTVPAKDPNYKYQDIIILMSDGLNTENRWDGNGSWQSSAVDERTALACTNAKNAGLTVYTIHVNTDGDPTSQILKNCATDTTKFYTVTSSAQIGAVFTTIGSNLSQLRISK